MRVGSTRSARLTLGLALWLGLSCALGGANVARAGVSSDWMPSTPGVTWIYSTTEGVRDTVVCQGFAEFQGMTVIETRHTDSGVDAGLRQYWTVDGSGPSGALLLHGAWRPFDDFGLHHVPPIRWMQGPPAVGNRWAQDLVIHSLPDHSVLDSLHAELTVTEVLQLPLLGSTDAWGVALDLTPAQVVSASGRAYDLFGHRLRGTVTAGATSLPHEWFAPGFGEVQWSGDAVHTLVEFSSVVPTAATTWGRIKQLYR